MFVLASSVASQAQRQYDAWFFGTRSALQFQPGRYWPQVVATSAMNAFEASTTLSDSTTGALLLYSNGERVWDRRHEVMPNSAPLGGHYSASEGALAIFAPRQPGLVYVFTTDAKESSTRNGLRYSVVDLRLRNGLGDVTLRSQPMGLPNFNIPTEHLAAIRHPNGRDYWILVHGLENNSFYAFALTPSGVAAQPVVSSVGPVFKSNETAQTGIIRFAPSGRQLVTTRLFSALDLFDFDPATGQVSNPTSLYADLNPVSPTVEKRVYGAEFSGDGSVLYADQGGALMRYDLASCDPGTVVRSKRLVLNSNGFAGTTGSYRRAPNGRIYIAQYGINSLAVVDSCNSLNRAYVRPFGQPLAGSNVPNTPPAVSQYGLPNAPALSVRQGSLCNGGSGPLEDRFSLVATPGCIGTPTLLEVQPRGPVPQGIQQVEWTIQGTSGRLVLAGSRVAPVFGQPDLKYVSVVVTFTDGIRQSKETQFNIAPLATVRLQVNRAQPTCGEVTAEIIAVASTTGRFSWADDTTTSPRRVVPQNGIYQVSFLSAAGCQATDYISLQPFAPERCLIPNIITPNGDQKNQRFVLAGYQLGHWQLTIFNRWGREVYANPRYANEWDAAGLPAGMYYYLLQHAATGTRLRGWVEVVR